MHEYRCLFILIYIFLSLEINAQVGIGTLDPHPSAALDVNAADQGFIAPRVSLEDVTNSVSPVNSPIEGLLVYNINVNTIGGSGKGYYYWNGTQWAKLVISNIVDEWKLKGNSGTDPNSDFLGTTDAQDLVLRTENTEKMRIKTNGNIGINNNNPTHKLDLAGDFRIDGDFINQQILGTHSGITQIVPFTNAVFTPLSNTTNSITITDGNGVDNSAVFISGFARVFGGNLSGTNSSIGGYFIILQRDVNPTFPTATNLTYTSGTCYLRTPNGASSASLPFGGGGHISYLDNSLEAGQTYYYRLAIYPIGIGITSGTYDIYQRDLIVMQLKR
jgi:hypothetical protein